MEPADNPSMPKRSRKRRNLHEQLAEKKEESEMMDLLEVVLTWLPVVVLFRMRLVCRRWNSLLTSPSFLQRWGEVAPTKQPWLFVKNGGIGAEALYDPFTKKWLRSARVPLLNLACVFPLTFAGGLVCYINYKQMLFLIGNPFNQCWKGLSCDESVIIQQFNFAFIVVGMVTISDKDILTSTWRSKIVLVDKSGNYEVFTISNNITSESPMITGRMPSHIKVPSEFSTRGVTIGTNLLFLGLEPHGIISYNVENGEWTQLLIPRPLNSSDLVLTECNGRMLLTGAVRETNSSTISIRVWKLETRVMRMWVEIDRMPSSLCLEFEGMAGTVYKCLCNKNVIMILLSTNRISRLYTYDVKDRKWSKVPKLALPK
ncbi:hypothetical protein V2J09_007040 [Rumex salicifolius]